MNAGTIQQLAWHLPRQARDTYSYRADVQALQDYGTDRFREAYSNLRFGWHAVVTLASNRLPFPGILMGDDHVLFEAYLHNCHPRYFSQDVDDAIALTRPDNRRAKEVIEALFLLEEATLTKVAEQVNMRRQVVNLYEKLFFNVMDRKADETFLAQLVYPDGRIPTIGENYHSNEALSRLLQRSGYDNGIYDVMFFAGFSRGLLKNLEGEALAEKIEKVVMSNALIWARNGYLNGSSSLASIRYAVGLLNSARLSGTTEGVKSPLSGCGAEMLSDLRRVKSAQQIEQTGMRNRLSSHDSEAVITVN